MRKSFYNFIFYSLILVCAINSIGCNSVKAKTETAAAETNTANQNAATDKGNTNAAKNAEVKAAPAVTVKSVVGTYEYYTYKVGKEGYSNTLTIQDGGNGKLKISVEGIYTYQANGAETFHEAEGSGEGELRGNSATIRMTDENDSPCKATITFALNRASLKIPDTCHFNILLDGDYKRKVSKPVSASKQTPTAKVKTVTYDEIGELTNDYDKHRAGEQYIINDVPIERLAEVGLAEKSDSNFTSSGFYRLSSADSEDNISAVFMTSAALAKSFRANKGETSSLRVSAILFEVAGGMEAYHCWFVTKVEGLDENGDLLWTAEGGKPSKVRYEY